VPRIPPLAPDDYTDDVREMLAPVADLNIFTTLARHPRVFRSWSRFGGVLLYRGELSDRHRELLILRTGWNCQSEYEWGQHVRIALDAGMSPADIQLITAGPTADGWTPLEAALLQAADEMHQSSRISSATWETLASTYNERQLIEVCMVVGQYHLVSFLLNSLGVEREPGVPGFPS
jgi:alkylhydroperoxidase family enzyme